MPRSSFRPTVITIAELSPTSPVATEHSACAARCALSSARPSFSSAPSRTSLASLLAPAFPGAVLSHVSAEWESL